MVTKLTERMEDWVPSIRNFLNQIAKDVSTEPELGKDASEPRELQTNFGGDPFRVPMKYLRGLVKRNEHKEDLLVLAINQAISESKMFLDHEPVPRVDRPDAPFAFVSVNYGRVHRRGGRHDGLTKPEDWFEVYTNNPVMLAANFEDIGKRAIAIAEEMGPQRGGQSGSDFPGFT